jgi:hypothetical protein
MDLDITTVNKTWITDTNTNTNDKNRYHASEIHVLKLHTICATADVHTEWATVHTHIYFLKVQVLIYRMFHDFVA